MGSLPSWVIALMSYNPGPNLAFDFISLCWNNLKKKKNLMLINDCRLNFKSKLIIHYEEKFAGRHLSSSCRQDNFEEAKRFLVELENQGKQW